MKYHWKKALWAALLTAAFAFSAVGCGSKEDNESSADELMADSVSDVAAQDAVASESSTDMTASDGEFQYEMNEDGTISITGYQGTETDLNVPATVDSYAVSSIANHAFEANWDLVSVTLPNGLARIEEGAFMDCGSLTSVNIPETVSQIDRAAFAGCSSLTSIYLPETVSEVREEAFTGCASMTELTVVNSSLQYDRWGLVEGAQPLSVTIICAPDSAISAWAAQNGVATQALS